MIWSVGRKGFNFFETYYNRFLGMLGCVYISSSSHDLAGSTMLGCHEDDYAGYISRVRAMDSFLS